MLPGPVFNVELVTTARRARYYAARVAYLLILLFSLWQTYESSVRHRRATNMLSIVEMSRFAEQSFTTFGIVQSIAVLLLVPTLLAGSIADETQRKTLHYLLASRLTSGEIIFGKLAARSLHLCVFLALGLPVISLLSLLGGVDPVAIVVLDVCTVTTSYLIAGLAVLLSTFARRVRDAILAVYILEAAWLAVPFAIESTQWWFSKFHAVVQPLNEWLGLTNPLYLWYMIERTGRGRTGVSSPYGLLGASVSLQVLFGSLFLVLAVLRLRPAFRKSGGEVPVRNWRAWWNVRRTRRRPAVSEDPMLWKERYVGRPGGMLRAVVRVVGAIALLGIAYGVYYWGRPALEELWVYGYAWVRRGARREEFNGYLRFVCTVLAMIWTIGVAAAAASSVTSEREEDTWISLTTTTLTGPEILGAKMLGAIWSLRALGLAMLCLWSIGVLTGAVHPFGLLAEFVLLAIFTWFATSLGTFISLRSRTTTRAMVVTIVILLITNGGYLLCCLPFEPDSPIIAFGCTPYQVAAGLLSYKDVWHIVGFETNAGGFFAGARGGEWLAAIVIGVIFYLTAAVLLTFGTLAGFDKVAGRARRSETASVREKQLLPEEVMS
jgi:ABC-type transport system involved in multi-copper enzyme maturation permease subunit